MIRSTFADWFVPPIVVSAFLALVLVASIWIDDDATARDGLVVI